ncbi:MAG: PatB family C-S lyase [Verrucomicrobiota bacterium]
MSFDDYIERRGTGSIKWDRRPELDPYWVADMDFRSPDCVLDALHKRIDHGIFGYAQAQESLEEAIADYFSTRHQIELDQSQLVHLGGLVPALSLAARAFGKPGDNLLTGTPIYPPFLGVAKDAGMETRRVPHLLVDDRWSFDLDGLEATVDEKSKLLLLCHPQNPLGRCFTIGELEEIGEFCQSHDLILVSDEIHCDLVLHEEATPFRSALHLPERLHDRLIVLQSPSKTYNIAGLGYAYAIIPDERLRKRFNAAKGHTLAEINCLAYTAAEAAYREGEGWRQELLAYLRKNCQLVTDFVRTELPDVRLPTIEATYLAWLDCSALDFENPSEHLEKNAQLFVSDGSYFGAKRCTRFNFGCSRDRVREGLEKVKRGFDWLD